MPTLREDLGYMQAAAVDAVAILGDVSLAALEQNREKQAALCYLVIVAGEMSIRISNRDEHLPYPGIDWEQLSGMRNILAHQPENADYTIIIDTITNDYPPLITAIDAILRELP